MPLDGDLWGTIEKQRQEAIDSPPSSIAAFREGYPRRTFFEELYDEAGSSEGMKRRIPLSYYTKACGWASDYPLLYRRVAGFINPGALDRISFDEYVLREFGCRSETLAKLTADGWFVPMLLREEQYESNAAEAVEAFFERVDEEETRWEVEPKYLNLVDTALEAAATELLDETDQYVRASGGDRVDIEATKRRWKEREPWASLQTKGIENVHGVGVHDDLQEYVVERAVKLRLLDDVYNVVTSDQARTNNIRELTERYASGSTETRDTLIKTAYVLWNHYGTPAYYCDFTGSVDVGPDPARRYVDYLLSQAKELFGNLWDRLDGTIRGEPLQTKELKIWETDGARLSELLRHSPSEVRDLGLSERYRFLADRADHFDDHYEALRDRLNTVVDDGKRYGEYETIVADHNDRTPSLSRRVRRRLLGDTTEGLSARHIASGIGDTLHVGTAAWTLLDLARHAEAYDLVPTPESALFNFAGATFRVPDRIADLAQHNDAPAQLSELTADDVGVVERDDVSYADVWRMPYAGRNERIRKFRWVAEETLANTFSPLP